MKPEQAAGLRDYFLQSLKEEAKATRRVIEAVPDGKGSYKPDPKSRSGFELAWHIAATDAWFLDGILAGAFDPATDTGNAVPAGIKSAADIVAFYDKSYVAKLDKLAGLSPEACAAVVSFFGVFNFPMAIYIAWLEKHQIHHRGQLCAYLRAMGGKVPSVYGGSADEPMEMGAGA